MDKILQVIMLPTNNGVLQLENNILEKVYPIGSKHSVHQHLYIYSTEEIKEGDWYIHSGMEWNKPNKPYQNVYQCNKGHRLHNNGKEEGYFVDGFYAADCKKIIATTDKSLELLSIPQSFISLFIEEYNKGNIIKEVMVEYEKTDFKAEFVGGVHDGDSYEYKIKPKLNDNEIIISEVKDYIDTVGKCANCGVEFHIHKEVKEKLYTRAEMIQFGQDCMLIGVKSQREGFSFNEKFIELVEERNL